jgi:hypothetical protein
MLTLSRIKYAIVLSNDRLPRFEILNELTDPYKKRRYTYILGPDQGISDWNSTIMTFLANREEGLRSPKVDE